MQVPCWLHSSPVKSLGKLQKVATRICSVPRRRVHEKAVLLSGVLKLERLFSLALVQEIVVGVHCVLPLCYRSEQARTSVGTARASPSGGHVVQPQAQQERVFTVAVLLTKHPGGPHQHGSAQRGPSGYRRRSGGNGCSSSSVLCPCLARLPPERGSRPHSPVSPIAGLVSCRVSCG